MPKPNPYPNPNISKIIPNPNPQFLAKLDLYSDPNLVLLCLNLTHNLALALANLADLQYYCMSYCINFC